METIEHPSFDTETFENQRFDQERALYGRRELTVRHCTFDGPADGESAFKECEHVMVDQSFFNLRYPFWHGCDLVIYNSEFTENCRAALWYSKDIVVNFCKLHGIKALRECDAAAVLHSSILSPEFGWSSKKVALNDCTAEGEYFCLRGEQVSASELQLKGKYAFQYIKDSSFDHCAFDTKDAFWHANNVKVEDSVIKGEYLGWYSQGLTLERCKIIGTQPLCYCKGLKLIDCEMIDTDLAFEKSEVEATVATPIISVKNPRSGTITAPGVGEVIMDDPEAQGKVMIGGQGPQK